MPANWNKGLSLVEIMVAMTIFGIGVSMALRTLPDSNSATTKSRNMAKATNLAQQKLEELLQLDYSDDNLGDGTHNDPKNPIDVHFAREWIVKADSPVANMKTVDVKVTYPPGEANDSVELVTTITIGR
jgi:prepilin-type N-terminal cleavage/methylation domain-containing protein